MIHLEFYKISMKLAHISKQNDLNFLEKFNEISEAKDTFNTKFKKYNFIFLLNPTQNTLNFILRVNSENTIVEDINIETLSPFLNVIIENIHLKYKNQSTAESIFDISIIKRLEPNDCKNIIQKLKIEYSDFYDLSDSSYILNDIEELLAQNETSFAFDDDEEYMYENRNFEQGSTVSLEDALNKINLLAGCEDFKTEIYNIIKFKELSNKLENVENITFPYNYLFTTKYTVDQLEAIRLLTEVFFHLGLIKSRGLVKLSMQGMCHGISGPSVEDYFEEENTGVVFIRDISEVYEENVDINSAIDSLIRSLHPYKNKILFIISFYSNSTQKNLYSKLKESLDNNLNYKEIGFNSYSYNDILNFVKRCPYEKGYHITEKASEVLTKHLQKSINDIHFDLKYETEKLIERAIYKKKFKILDNLSFNEKSFKSLCYSDFKFLSDKFKEHNPNFINPFEELDNMIGLKDVKERVNQISNFIKVKIKKEELGMKTKPVCLHMEFTGNPGTGKTTVARIIGKVFKELGFLSSGHFVEVTRENLVGPYIGQTAPKVMKAVKDAKGGIMFIDEAYSLYQNDDNDFGNEAVSTLVKEMEDFKDDLVIIFAGYPKEMDKMINMNPGLRDRIAFKIEFPDYTVDELLNIFKKMCDDNNYSYTENTLKLVQDLISLLYKNKGNNFGNGRIIRKIFERIEIIQNNRICSTNEFSKDKINLITDTDINSLYEDNEIKKIIDSFKNKKSLGFSI